MATWFPDDFEDDIGTAPTEPPAPPSRRPQDAPGAPPAPPAPPAPKSAPKGQPGPAAGPALPPGPLAGFYQGEEVVHTARFLEAVGEPEGGRLRRLWGQVVQAGPLGLVRVQWMDGASYFVAAANLERKVNLTEDE